MSDEPFLARWSRLKRRHGGAAPVIADETAEEADAPPPPEAAALHHPPPAARTVDDGTERPQERVDDAPPADMVPDDLPPLESLTKDSDFTPFLRAGVPETLRKEALRRLWVSDPVLANLSGLNDYEDDYGALFRGGLPVKTLYRVGRGLLAGDDDAPKAGPAETPPVEAASEAMPPAALPPAAPPDGAPAASDDPEPEARPNPAA